MGRSHWCLLVSVISCLCAGWACGDDFDPDRRHGWYVAGSGGWTSSSDLKVDGSDATDEVVIPDVEISLDPGYTGQVSAGMLFDRVRGEFELGYRANDAADVSLDGADVTFRDGDFSAFTIAVNGLYDFPIGGCLGGYVGGGAGIGIIDCSASAQARDDGPAYSIDADTSGLVLQFMAGLQCRLARQWYLTAGYRLWVLMDADISVNTTGGGGGTVIVEDDSNQMDPMLMHTVEIGLRYEF